MSLPHRENGKDALASGKTSKVTLEPAAVNQEGHCSESGHVHPLVRKLATVAGLGQALCPG